MHKFFTENGASFGVCSFFAKDKLLVENAIDVDKVSAKLQLAKEKGTKGIFIGFVDNDKKKQSFFETFELVTNKEGVILKRLDNLYLISLSPQVDGFIFTNAKEKNIDLSKISFSNDKKKFVKGLKTLNIEKSPNFKTLINDLYYKKSSCFVALQEAFEYIYSQKI